MYEDTEQMSDGHRRSLSLPSHLGRQSSGQKRRDGPSIWDLQEALRREGHLDAESECTSEPGSEPSSAASTPHGSLGASSGAAFAEQFENAYGGGSWPRVRKQRTSERSASFRREAATPLATADGVALIAFIACFIDFIGFFGTARAGGPSETGARTRMVWEN